MLLLLGTAINLTRIGRTTCSETSSTSRHQQHYRYVLHFATACTIILCKLVLENARHGDELIKNLHTLSSEGQVNAHSLGDD